MQSNSTIDAFLTFSLFDLLTQFRDTMLYLINSNFKTVRKKSLTRQTQHKAGARKV